MASKRLELDGKDLILSGGILYGCQYAALSYQLQIISKLSSSHSCTFTLRDFDAAGTHAGVSTALGYVLVGAFDGVHADLVTSFLARATDRKRTKEMAISPAASRKPKGTQSCPRRPHA